MKKPHSRRRPSLRKLRDLFFGASRSSGKLGHRSPFHVESLEDRLLLAGDLGLDQGSALDPTLDRPPADPGSTPIETGQSFAALMDAEGEETPAQDLVAFAKALSDAGTKIFGAAWCPACTAQKELFEDGADFLPFIEVTNPDRTLNQIGIDENITAFPTWEFPDGTREVGLLQLDTVAQRAGVAIPTSVDPFVAPIEDQTVLGGSPLHLGLNGYDANGSPLTFTVTSSNPSLVTPTVISGNRSARVSVQGWGDMVFELFEGRVPRAAGRFIELAQSGFYDAANNDPDVTMHRVIDDFVLQFGDPTGTGAGGSTLGDFDDQFHPDLQHNNPGGLSWAKSGDDTNDSQVFVLDVPTRFLDFNHSYFGQLTEGDKVRNAISGTATDASDRPLVPINIESVQVFDDTENAIVMLKATEGASGEADITVTVTDQDNNQYTETFQVTVAPDQFNGGPYLDDIPTILTTVNSPATFQLSAIDVEGDPVLFDGVKVGSIDYTFTVDSQTGQVVVTPPADYIGTLDIMVRVRPDGSSNTSDLFDSQVVTVVVASDAPTGVDLLAADDSGVQDDDDVTNQTTLQFEISGVSDGAVVRLHDGDTIVGQADASGSSVVITTSSLAASGDGSYSLFATQLINGVESQPSSALDVTVDTTAPPEFTSTPPSAITIGQNLVYNAENPEEGTTGTSYALSGAPNGVAIDATDGTLTWSPLIVDEGQHQFAIDIRDAAGNVRSQTLDIEVIKDSVVGIELEITDIDGNLISIVDVGDDFLLNVYVQDLRFTAAGVFAAFLDVLYDANLVGVDGQIEFGDEYSSAQSGDTGTLGLIDEIGAISGFDELDGQSYLLFRVPMQAKRSGAVTFTADPADDLPSNEVLVYGESDAIPAEKVSYGTSTLNINVAFGANNDLFNVDEDSSDTTLDVLENDEVFPGSTGELTITEVGATSAGGTVTVADDGKSVTYTPVADFFGEDSFTYTVTDGTGTGQATVTVQVAPTNDDPTAVDDSFVVMEDSGATALAVLDNDLITPDADETLEVISVGTSTNGGTVTIATGGSHVLYTPATDYFGADSFTYSVSDGNGGTSQATVNLTVTETNDPPAARDDLFNVTEDSTENTLDVLANDDTASDQNETLSLTEVGIPENGGTVAIADDQLSLIYSPAPDFFGSERFTYTISDGNGGTAQASIVVIVAGTNDPPTANDDSLAVVKDADTQRLDVLANDSSLPDGDEVLTITAVGPTSSGGTVTISDDGQAVQYTPPAGFTGNDTFTYTIQDPEQAEAEATVTVNVREFIPSELSGYIFIDVNNDGTMNEPEAPLGGVVVTLLGTDMFDAEVNLQQVSDAAGFYQFTDLAPGQYTLSQTQPEFLIDGTDTIGTQGGQAENDQLVIDLQQGTDGQNNNFAERGRQARYISLSDFFALTPRDSVLTATNADDQSHWYAIEGGWSKATQLDVQLDQTEPTAQFDVTDDEAENFNTTLLLHEPTQVQMLGAEAEDTLLRIVGQPQALFPDADCACAPGESASEGEAGSTFIVGASGAEGEPLVVTPSTATTTPITSPGLLTTLPFGEANGVSASMLRSEPIVTSVPVTIGDTRAVDTLMSDAQSVGERPWTEEIARDSATREDVFSETVDLLMADLLPSEL